MKWLSIIIVTTIASLNLFSQDSLWKKIVIDENLTVSFPAISSELDTVLEEKGKKMRMRLLQSELPFSTLVLLTTPNETNLNVNNRESLKTALAGIAKGMSKTMSGKGLECLISDTTIDDLLCKKLMCMGEESLSAVNYVFLVNDRMYSFQASSQVSSSEQQDINRLLKSIHFNKTAIKEQQFDSNPEALGYLVGKLIMGALVIAAIIYLVRRNIS